MPIKLSETPTRIALRTILAVSTRVVALRKSLRERRAPPPHVQKILRNEIAIPTGAARDSMGEILKDMISKVTYVQFSTGSIHCKIVNKMALLYIPAPESKKFT